MPFLLMAQLKLQLEVGLLSLLALLLVGEHGVLLTGDGFGLFGEQGVLHELIGLNRLLPFLFSLFRLVSFELLDVRVQLLLVV